MGSPPNCFGDDVYYAETSRICNNCGYRAECAAQVNKEGYRSGWKSPETVTTSRSTSTNKTNGRIAPIIPTAGSGALSIGSSVYNHRSALAPQFMRYLGYSVAEATLEEARVLVQSMRNNYTAEQVNANAPQDKKKEK